MIWNFIRGLFEQMAEKLEGATEQCVISFIDLYEKTKRNFPEVRTVTGKEQQELMESFARSAKNHGMCIHLCLEDARLAEPYSNVDAAGCFSQGVLEKAIGAHLRVPKKLMAREGCNCLLGGDIGAYNSCLHACRYCYANYDREIVEQNYRQHDPASSFLIGHAKPGDIIKEAEQKSWIDGQMTLFDLL